MLIKWYKLIDIDTKWLFLSVSAIVRYCQNTKSGIVLHSSEFSTVQWEYNTDLFINDRSILQQEVRAVTGTCSVWLWFQNKSVGSRKPPSTQLLRSKPPSVPSALKKHRSECLVFPRQLDALTGADGYQRGASRRLNQPSSVCSGAGVTPSRQIQIYNCGADPSTLISSAGLIWRTAAPRGSWSFS